MKRIANIRPVAMCAAVLVLSPMAYADEKERSVPGAETRSHPSGCEANLREFRQSLRRSENELAATSVEARRRAILGAVLKREDLSAIVRCLAAAQAR